MAAEHRKPRRRRGELAVDNGEGQSSLLASSASSESEHEPSRHLAGRRSGPDVLQKMRRDLVDSPSLRDTDRLVQALEEEEEKDHDALDPSNHSFSIALQECKNRRRASVEDPAGVAMRKAQPVSGRDKSGILHSPNYQKGWSSERVPLPGRNLGSSTLLPYGGKPLPSKWEDAEKWICSPVNGIGRPAGLPPHHRRPKSKSGPLSSPFELGFAFSPPVAAFEGARKANLPENSPFLTGVLVAERGGCCGSVSSCGGSGSELGLAAASSSASAALRGGRGGSCSNGNEEVSRGESLLGGSELHSPCSPPSPQDKGLYHASDSVAGDSSMIQKKDVATQMSPNGSSRSSSSKERALSSLTPDSSPAAIEERQGHFSKVEVRDVQVDDRVTMTRWTKKNAARGPDKVSANSAEWKKKEKKKKRMIMMDAVEIPPEMEKSMSKIKREEARITAWENLQKAKAEAAIQKLEMKLEKERSSSMDKILQKLNSAQTKAHDMRNNLASEQAYQAARTGPGVSGYRKAGQTNYFWSCFTCRFF
ncbi:uncharacterized protein LOC144713911 [Wolffia australiana]